jgi:prepilin-type N-terminal cleavage/methylation domain-containing protein/prepilin-type processing-associated H-X9-DG protein
VEYLIMKRRAFTLIELLVVISIIALLVAMLMPSLAKAKELARSALCLGRLRSIGVATHMYASGNRQLLPRSQMSASYSGTQPWEKSLMPWVGGNLSDVLDSNHNTAYLNSYINELYRCPSDPRPLATPDSTQASYKLSFGENGYFELNFNDPLVDDWPGKPATWHTVDQVPTPGTTVFYGELAITAVMNDHFMPYYWFSDQNANKEIDGLRHGDHANYVFVDGHAELKTMVQVWKWAPAVGDRIDQFNPSLAR